MDHDSSSKFLATVRMVEDLDFRILRYLGCGRNFMKRHRCSPDAYIQLALQLAYFRWVCRGLRCQRCEKKKKIVSRPSSNFRLNVGQH